MRKFGLIGEKLEHSFSKHYFTEKFAQEKITDAAYELYELPEIAAFPALLAKEPKLIGLNVTVPYKESVIRFLDDLDENAQKIGAVNTIKIQNGKTKGYNTDYIGFRNSLMHFCPPEAGAKALILGTGGAAKAVSAVLKDLRIPFKFVSRKSSSQNFTYSQITPKLLQKYHLIINTTPLGMYPHVAQAPQLPYQALNLRHHLYDLVYNPEETLFLKRGKEAGASVKNGLEMLFLQAEASWKIWNSSN